MKRENMTQQDFARAIDVSPASLSNIFNGKTNPTNNHVSAIHRCFPDINVNWLMFGEGDMYSNTFKKANEEDSGMISAIGNDDGVKVENEGTLFDEPEVDERSFHLATSKNVPIANERQEEAPVSVIREVVKYIDKPQRKITEIRIFFDDGTFEVFS